MMKLNILWCYLNKLFEVQPTLTLGILGTLLRLTPPPPIEAYPHVNKEPQNRAARLLASFNGYHCKQKTPYSQQEEDYRDED